MLSSKSFRPPLKTMEEIVRRLIVRIGGQELTSLGP